MAGNIRRMNPNCCEAESAWCIFPPEKTKVRGLKRPQKEILSC